MTAAITAAKNGAEVTVLDKNKKVGRKLMITGKGRCNVTNNCEVRDFIPNVPTNGKFLFSAINSFTPADTISFFEENGLPLKTERGRRVFPVSDKALDVVDCFFRLLKKYRCTLVSTAVSSLIIQQGKAAGVIDVNGKSYTADSVIIATGGKSYPLTGSNGDGYILAQSAGHTVIPPKPSLVPLVCKEAFVKQLQGLSLKNISVTVTDTQKNKEIYSDFGELLFTHFGLSGPVILSASAHMRNMESGRYAVSIDLKPALDRERLEKRLQRDFDKNCNKDFSNSLNELLPKSLIPVIISLSEIPSHIKCNQITKEQRSKLAEIIKNLKISVDSFRPIEEAIITSGGINVKEINPKTMQSKLVNNLYFAGEVIDVDAYTGGFNLQIAYSTGYLAGMNCTED